MSEYDYRWSFEYIVHFHVIAFTMAENMPKWLNYVFVLISFRQSVYLLKKNVQDVRGFLTQDQNLGVKKWQEKVQKVVGCHVSWWFYFA